MKCIVCNCVTLLYREDWEDKCIHLYFYRITHLDYFVCYSTSLFQNSMAKSTEFISYYGSPGQKSLAWLLYFGNILQLSKFPHSLQNYWTNYTFKPSKLGLWICFKCEKTYFIRAQRAQLQGAKIPYRFYPSLNIDKFVIILSFPWRNKFPS